MRHVRFPVKRISPPPKDTGKPEANQHLMTTPACYSTPLLERLPMGARFAGLLLALIAIPVLMWAVDPIVGRYSVPHSASSRVEQYLRFSDPLGNAPLIPAVGGFLLAAAAVRRSRRLLLVGVLVLLTFGACGAAVYALKMIVRRPRPWATRLAWSQTIRDWKWALNGQAHSFPSGDATCAAGLAMGLYLGIGRGRARYALFIIPAASAIGRIMGARHYPSDCIAGCLLGMGVCSLLWYFLQPRPALSQQTEAALEDMPC